MSDHYNLYQGKTGLKSVDFRKLFEKSAKIRKHRKFEQTLRMSFGIPSYSIAIRQRSFETHEVFRKASGQHTVLNISKLKK